MANHPRLLVSCTSALVDEAIDVRVSGCRPREAVTLTARIDDARRGRWRAQAGFVADATGVVDLRSARPVAGNYATADSLGLMWSLELDDASSPTSGIGSLSEPLTLELALEVDERRVDRVELQRRFLALGMRRISVHDDGLVGTFFAPSDQRARAGVLVIGGSDGGLSEGTAALLASRGFAVLAVAYFRAEHLPTELIEIPLEYFEKGIRWLASQPGVRPGGLGVVGRSRGGELALLLAATFQNLRAVVGYVPSGLIHAGIGSSSAPGAAPRSAWIHQGRPLPFLPPPATGPSAPSASVADSPLELTPMFLRSLENRAAVEAAGIPVERICGPVLLISGEDDRLWPSPVLAEIAVARLARCKHPYPVTHLRYSAAGHMIGPIGLPATVSTVLHPLRGRALALGGMPAGNAAAAFDSWPRVIGFLHSSLESVA